MSVARLVVFNFRRRAGPMGDIGERSCCDQSEHRANQREETQSAPITEKTEYKERRNSGKQLARFEGTKRETTIPAQ